MLCALELRRCTLVVSLIQSAPGTGAARLPQLRSVLGTHGASAMAVRWPQACSAEQGTCFCRLRRGCHACSCALSAARCFAVSYILASSVSADQLSLSCS